MKCDNTAVIMFSMGTPDKEEDVEQFLQNIFLDPDIIKIPGGKYLFPIMAKVIAKRRTKKTKSYYQSLEGKSPLLINTINQARKVQNMLEDVKIFIAMRYWHPFLEEIIEEVANNYRNIILLPLYPQYSRTTTGSFYNHFNRVVQEKRLNFSKIRFIKSYHDDELFISAILKKIKEMMNEHNEIDLARAAMILSAHSIPKYIEVEGDPYIKQVFETARLVEKGIRESAGNKLKIKLAFQSRVGLRRWVGPFLPDVMRMLIKKREAESMIIVPIAFVADNVETIQELGVVFRQKAYEYGAGGYYLVECVNDEDLFIECLCKLIERELSEMIRSD